jgi:carboxyl-terminal processing protease
VKGRYDKPDVLNDTDPSVQYTGPLVIMVNEFSASASEIMAAAMQDYGRAVIVGTPTYGKGTVQRFFNLDRAVSRNGNSSLVDKDGKPLGALGDLKVTIQKFFRVNGGSTQLKGVTPDIILPDSYMEIPVGERDNEHPLVWSQIGAAKYSQGVVDLKKLPQIVASSQKRVAKNPIFTAYAENAHRMKVQRENSEYPLNIKEYRALEAKRDAEVEKFKAVIKPIESFVAENIGDDLTALNAGKDSSKIIRNREWLKDVKKDAHLYETLMVVRDLIQNAIFKTAAAEVKN